MDAISAKTGPLFESLPRPLLKSGLQPLGRYGTHQETISRRPEQMYTLSDTRLEWLGEELLFKLDSNKRWRAKMQPIFESYPSPLLKSGMGPLTTRKPYVGDLNRSILHFTQDWSGPWRDHYSSWTQINTRGPKCGHYSSHPWAIIYVKPGALGQVRHQCKSLSYVAEYVHQICWK